MTRGAGTLTNGYWNATFDSTTLADGFYNLSVNATNAQLLTNISENLSIVIDNTAANVSAVVPANDTTQTGSFLINASVNDTLTKVFNTTFKLISASGVESAWLYAELNSGNIDQGYWNTTFDATTITDGPYNITINATDFAGNQNIVNISRVTIETQPPNNTITQPLTQANISGTFLINASINDTSNIDFVNLTIFNISSNATAIIPMTRGAGTLTNGYWNATFDSSIVADGFYNLSVNATNAAGLVNISENLSIVIDNTAANVSMVTPVNHTTQNGSMLINASVNDTLTKVFNTTFRIINPTIETTWLYAELNSGNNDQGYWNTTFDTTTLNDGTYNITINATDFAGNQLLANISQIEIDNIANATIIDPVQNANISGTFLINASINSSNLEVKLVNLTIFNSSSNATAIIPMSNITLSLTNAYWNATIISTNFPEGHYNLSVNATTEQGTNITENISITIDNTAANISAVSPSNNTNFTGLDILINASVNDTLTKVFNVSFKLYNSTTNGSIWLYAELNSGTTDQGYWNTTINSSLFVNGYYNITINATDFAGNQILRNISNINISNDVGNTPPIIYNVTAPILTLIAGSHFATVNITFNVTDADGVDDLTDATAGVNITLAGVTRQNTSGNCQVITSSFNNGKDRTYSCLVAFRFHDNASDRWIVNATVTDSQDNIATNDTAADGAVNLTINSLTAFSLVLDSLTLSSGLSSTNNEVTFTVNNTGNVNFTGLNLTPYALNASITDFLMLGGETTETRGSANFSFNTSSSSLGFGIGLINATPINISNLYIADGTGVTSTLPHAPFTDATDITFANRTFYIYIDLPNDKGLSSGVTYNTSPALPWEIIATS